MTNSQLRAIAGYVLTTLSSTLAGLAPFVPLMPMKYQIGVGIAGAVVGGWLSTFNQSASQAHVSLPVDEARRLGLADEEKG